MYNIKLWDVGPAKSVGYRHNIIVETNCGTWDAQIQLTHVCMYNIKLWETSLCILYINLGISGMAILYSMYGYVYKNEVGHFRTGRSACLPRSDTPQGCQP